MKQDFKITYRVIYGDTDCAGVLYYGNYLRLFEIARTELLRTLGISYRQVEEEEGIILPVVEAYVRYKAPAYYDDELDLLPQLKELKPYKIRFDYSVYKEDKLIAQGFTVHVPIKKDGSLTRFPSKILDFLQRLLVDRDAQS